MASRYPNNGVQKRGVRNSRATREWPATNGSSAYSRLGLQQDEGVRNFSLRAACPLQRTRSGRVMLQAATWRCLACLKCSKLVRTVLQPPYPEMGSQLPTLVHKVGHETCLNESWQHRAGGELAEIHTSSRHPGVGRSAHQREKRSWLLLFRDTGTTQ